MIGSEQADLPSFFFDGLIRPGKGWPLRTWVQDRPERGIGQWLIRAGAVPMPGRSSRQKEADPGGRGS